MERKSEGWNYIDKHDGSGIIRDMEENEMTEDEKKDKALKLLESFKNDYLHGNIEELAGLKKLIKIARDKSVTRVPSQDRTDLLNYTDELTYWTTAIYNAQLELIRLGYKGK